jgi:hypothetical protein
VKLADIIYWEPGMPLPAPAEVLNAGNGMCCVPAARHGSMECICWQPVWDTEQQDLRPSAPAPASPPRMCADCAYRPRSPERTGDPSYKGDTGHLQAIATAGDPFWCHQGMRRPLKWVHPSGAEIPGSPANYRPPIRGGVPYKADGTAADLCSGWYLLRARQAVQNAPAAELELKSHG